MKGFKMFLGVFTFIIEVIMFIVYIPFFLIGILFEMLGPFLIAGIIIAGIAYSTSEDKEFTQSSASSSTQEKNITNTVTKENW